MTVRRFVDLFDRFLLRFFPDPFSLTILLTISVFLMGWASTSSSPNQLLNQWGNGFWSLSQFTLQMVMVLLSGFVLGTSPPFRRLLLKIAGGATSNGQAIFLVTFCSGFFSWVHWSLGLVVGGLLCKELVSRVKPGVYPLVVASAYSGFLLWHGGLSGSIPLLISTPGNFSESWLGGTIPISDTIFSIENLIIVIFLMILLPLVNYSMLDAVEGKKKLGTHAARKGTRSTQTVGRRGYQEGVHPIGQASILSWMLFGFASVYLIMKSQEPSFRLDLNSLNFILLFLGILLHKTPLRFMTAISEGARRTGEVLVLFPLYAAVMSMMKESGLGFQISDWLISWANPQTLPFWAFFSAGVVNFFVPSGGGQWAIQGPVVMDAAQTMGADLARVAMAVAWGDAWTNMIQPFWALPLLAIAGLRVRDIMGYCFVIFLVSGVVISSVILVLNG